MKRGEQAYQMRLEQRTSWEEISCDVGISPRGTLRAARLYAVKHHKPWPIPMLTKGGAIYSARKVMTWKSIANRYGDSIEAIKRLAYKHAKRRDLQWPIR